VQEPRCARSICQCANSQRKRGLQASPATVASAYSAARAQLNVNFAHFRPLGKAVK
jgi:hypothetical protein